jgi:UDP-N-acetylmuramoylalanine--D-glutamate ligase
LGGDKILNFILMININFLQNKEIAVLGLGINNEKLVDFLLKNNLAITICDQDEAKSIKLPRYSGNKLVSWRLGKKYLDKLTDFDIIFRSPGIPFLNKKIQQAKKRGVEISSQTKLFFELCPGMIIGVTGTKGKGTTSTLIYEILKKSGKRVYLAGNIGEDPFNYLEKLKPEDIIVLELSSFQLQDLDKSPHIAVVLNIATDHLDHHKDRKEYIDAKKRITKFQTQNDYVVVNVDYQDSKSFSKISPSRNLYFSVKKKVRAGCYYKDGWLYWNGEAELRLGKAGALPFQNTQGGLKICPRKDIKLLGEHNLENVAAAVSASIVAGAKINAIKQTLKTFKGLEHRLEYAGKVRGVKYYNDSFSTTPETAIAGINSFDQPIILIAGGSDKGADFGLLAQEIVDNKVKAVILIGEMGDKILGSLLKLKIFNLDIKIIKQKEIGSNKGAKLPIGSLAPYCLQVVIGCKTMGQVVRTANKVAKKGDIVLLSPACASFDMFKNYKERGERFKEEIYNLKLQLK